MLELIGRFLDAVATGYTNAEIDGECPSVEVLYVNTGNSRHAASLHSPRTPLPSFSLLTLHVRALLLLLFLPDLCLNALDSDQPVEKVGIHLVDLLRRPSVSRRDPVDEKLVVRIAAARNPPPLRQC